MKKGKILGLMAMSAVLLAGCADAMPELTDDESELIAEYAADLLVTAGQLGSRRGDRNCSCGGNNGNCI